MEKQILCAGDQNGIKRVLCPLCDHEMVKEDGGYSENFINGEYDQTEHSYYWHCEYCDHCEDE